MNLDLLVDLRIFILDILEDRTLKGYKFLDNFNIVGTLGLGRRNSEADSLSGFYEQTRYNYRMKDNFIEIYFNSYLGYFLFSRESEENKGEYGEFYIKSNVDYIIDFDSFDYQVISFEGGLKGELKFEKNVKKSFFLLNPNTE